MKENAALLSELAASVSKFLGVPDADYTISRFVLSLFDSLAVVPDGSQRLVQFQNTLKGNGGEDFPPEFVRETFNSIDKTRSSVRIKTEPHNGVKSEPPKEVKVEQHEVKTEQHEVKTEQHEEKTEPRRVKTEPHGVKAETHGVKLGYSSLELANSKFKLETPKSSRQPHQSNPLEIGKTYKGYVSNITAFGAFIRLHSPTSFISGLCHVSKMLFNGRTRIRQPQDVVQLNQQVYVKIMDLVKEKRRDKISLSMVGIDQLTGIDRLDELEHEPRGRIHETPKKRKRLTSPERWEIRQMIKSGAASAADYPELNGYNDDDEIAEIPEEEVHVDIELNTSEPVFLKGQTSNGTVPNPMLILKNPEGSLSRAAMSGSKLAQTMKEERLQQKKDAEKEARLARDSSDPLRKMSEQDLRLKTQTEIAISEWRKSQQNQKVEYGKRTNLSIEEQRETLPVYAMRSRLVKAIRENQFLVIVGETGSGKTTQIVQYIYEEALNVSDGVSKIIGCTQPRRVAAVSVAKRVAEEFGCKVGHEVGYLIRFEDVTCAKTKIKYMTDGMLQREALLDPSMLKYSVIMLDEAHERTVATDVLFALLKDAARLNPHLKVIVTSATLDSKKFSHYFNDCPILQIPGRTFPVEVMFSREPEPDYLAAALDCVMQIHVAEPDGDILVFLTGQEEIDTSCEALYSRIKTLGKSVPDLIILPVYSSLPSEMQTRIFEPAPPGSRKVVLATNIAETSITIDGIRFVVDPGFVKINAYDPKLGMDLLIVSPISQAQANQRSGRAGRTGPGKCFRLYTEGAYNTEMLPNSIPEIQRQNLASTILMLKAMGINDLLNFEFMDPPPASTMVTALRELYTLDALDDNGYLTALGRRMAEFPMEPKLAKTVLASVELECASEVLSVVAMLSVQTVFYRPKEKQAAADNRKQRFHSIHGDHLTLLNVFRAWELNGRSSAWCKENFIHERSMRRAYDVRKQLVTIMGRYKLPVDSCDDTAAVRRALCSGFFRNLAKRDPHEGVYNTVVDQTPVTLHPLLALYGKSIEYVVYHTLLLTTKEYMHCVTAIDPRWLVELAPRFFRQSDPENMSERKRREKIVPLFDRFAESQDAWRLTAQVQAKKRALAQLNQ